MDSNEPKEQKLTKEGLYSGFLVLLRYMSQYRRDIITLSVMGIVSALGNGSIPYIAGKFFDALTNPPEPDTSLIKAVKDYKVRMKH